MSVIRASKVAVVTAVALLASLAAFGNITDYGTNRAFVEHVLMMDTIFPEAAIKYRAIKSPALHQTAYILIIGVELLTALICWIGAFRLLRHLKHDARSFNQAKGPAIVGLTLGFLLWQVGFMSIGGEWFGMWMSKDWNGVPSAFRFLMTILGVLIYVSLPDGDGLDEDRKNAGVNGGPA